MPPLAVPPPAASSVEQPHSTATLANARKPELVLLFRAKIELFALLETLVRPRPAAFISNSC
jgi:hypothetical protein